MPLRPVFPLTRLVLPGLMSAALPSAATAPDTSSQPFEVEELHQRFFGWTGKDVTVAGYPMLFFDNDPLETRVRLHVEPGKKDTEPGLMHGDMAARDDEPLSRNQVVLIRGRITSAVDAYVEMEACERVGGLDALPESRTTPLDIDSLDAETIVRVDELRDAARGLLGQEVTVRGYFNGWTTSQVDDRTIHHVELQDADTHRKGIHVQLTTAPTAELAVPRRVHLVRGRIDGALGEQVKLVDADIIASDVQARSP